MSGSDLPYHLRQNKTVDRDIFFSLLANLNVEIPINEYKYIGMGGPMLEDFRLLHQSLGFNKLESIEKDSATFTRQKFNLPYGCINCEELSTSEYIDNFDREEPTIMWLDYTTTKWQPQFNDIHSLLSKLTSGDILKVTFNANPDTLKPELGSSSDQRDVFLQRAGGKYTSKNIKANDVRTMPRFATTIKNIFQTITESALDMGCELTFEPLTSFRYIDNRHHMLTITGIIMPEVEDRSRDALLTQLGLSDWSEMPSDWNEIREINLPDLTSKEKLHMNTLLPHDIESFDFDSLPFKIHKNEDKNRGILENYLKYYRFPPSFQRTTY